MRTFQPFNRKTGIMKMAGDFILFVLQTVFFFAITKTPLFAVAVAIGVAVAVLTWPICRAYTHLWNRVYPLPLGGVFCCLIAGAFYFVLVVGYASLGYADTVAKADVAFWEVASLAKAAPPTTEDNGEAKESRLLQSATARFIGPTDGGYADAHPYLSRLVDLPSSQLLYTAGGSERRPSGGRRVDDLSLPSIEGAARSWRRLDEQAAHAITVSRITLVSVVALVEVLCFGALGWAAFRDIRVSL